MPPAIRITELGPHESARAVHASLGIDSDVSEQGFRYELLRAVAWASTRGQAPVSTRTLLDRAVTADAAVRRDPNDATRRRFLRDRLDDLAAVGDLAILGRGQWISAIGCLTGTAGADRDRFLVSGIPMRHFADELRATIALSGPTRIVTGNIDAAAYGLPWVPVEDWSRIPRQALDEWTLALLEGSPKAGNHRPSAGTTEFYVPDRAAPGATQERRWFAADAQLNGRYLARHRILGEWVDYSIIELDAGISVDHLQCDAQDVRRLMYGLDRKYHNPTIAGWHVDSGTAHVTLQNRLPYAETRALILLAEPTSSTTWSVRHNVSEVHRLLTGLGIGMQK